MLDPGRAADYLARYDGVDPGALRDGAPLLDRPELWAALLGKQRDEGDGPWNERIWPVLRLGAGDADLAVIRRHHDGGFDYVVLPAGPERALVVTSTGVDGWGPGLSWPEALRLVDHGRLGTPAQRLVLLHPAIGDSDAPPTAVDLLADALIAVCAPRATPVEARETARQLLDRTARWSTKDGALVCDAESSLRRPGGFPPGDLLSITQALA